MRATMTKLLILLLFLISLACSGCILNAFRSIQLPFRTNTSPEQFKAWVDAMNFSGDELDFHKRMNLWRVDNGQYKADGVADYPRHHLITHAWKRGDCDDWSSLFMEAAFQAGYEAKFVVVISPNGGHAVCVFKNNNDEYCHNSNWKNVRTGYKTLQDVASSIYPDWTYMKIYGRNIKKYERINNQ